MNEPLSASPTNLCAFRTVRLRSELDSLIQGDIPKTYELNFDETVYIFKTHLAETAV